MSGKYIQVERQCTLTKSISEEGEFEGYASVFDVEDHGGDTVKKGAFRRGLEKLIKEKRKVKMLWHHQRWEPIGVYKEVYEDDTGLYFRGQMTLGVQRADETRLLMMSEAVDSVSIGGYVAKEKWDNKTGKRDLLEIELKEISPVTFPMLDAARIVSVKSLPDDAGVREVEKCLREAGFSTSEARRLIRITKGTPEPREAVLGRATIEALQKSIRSMRADP